MLSAMITMITVITMIQITQSFCASIYSTCRPVTSTNPALRRLRGGATDLKKIQITSALFFILFSSAWPKARQGKHFQYLKVHEIANLLDMSACYSVLYSVFIFTISSSTSKSLPVLGDIGIIASQALYLSSCGPSTVWDQVRLSVSLTGGLTPPPYQLVPAGSFTNLSTNCCDFLCKR